MALQRVAAQHRDQLLRAGRWRCPARGRLAVVRRQPGLRLALIARHQYKAAL
jgi:hypothetical protein